LHHRPRRPELRNEGRARVGLVLGQRRQGANRARDSRRIGRSQLGGDSELFGDCEAARFSAPGRVGSWPGVERRHVGRVHEAGRLSGGDRIARIRGRRRAGRRSDAHGRPVAAAQTDEDDRAERRRACPLRGRSQTRDRRSGHRSVAHGMGGLVSRYYIDRLMGDRDVAQLIMLGSPHGGTPCANLPASLGFYLPATLELRSAYLAETFNRQVTRRHGVPFHLLAGKPVVEPFKAPCTSTPSDLVVSRPSVAAITAPISESPLPHADMTGSERVFKDFVAPRLLRRSGEFPAEADPKPLDSSAAPEQFTKVFTGHVDVGGSREVVINLDRLSAASFALYDTTRSLALSVRGANDAVINLTPDANGLVEVKDPAALFTLGC